MTSHSFTPADRFAWHEELRVFEAKRCLKYSSKLESCRLYWRAHRQLLHDGHAETIRVHRLLCGLAQAQKVLARSWRNKKYVPKTKRKEGYLESLQSSTNRLKATFNESSQRLSRLVDDKIQTLMQHSLDGVVHVTERGKSILELMEKTHNDTTAAWEVYFVSVKSSAAADDPTLLAYTPNIPKQKQGRATTSSKNANHPQDEWLAEVTYRSCVQAQMETWSTALEQLSRLFAAAQKVECRRRMSLRECMIAVWKDQKDNVMKPAEAAHSAPLVDWIGKMTSQKDVEQDIQASIEKLARAVKGLEEGDDDSIYTHFRAFANQDYPDVDEIQPLSDRLSVVGFYEELFSTGLQSDYVRHSCVVEVIQKASVLRSDFALCVITAESLMHLFWLRRKVDKPEDAFALISAASSDDPEQNECILCPKQSISLADMVVSSSSVGNKIDISLTKQSTTLSLLSSSKKEQDALLIALEGGKDNDRNQS